MTPLDIKQHGFYVVSWELTYSSCVRGKNEIVFYNYFRKPNGEYEYDHNKFLNLTLDLKKPLGDIESFNLYKGQTAEGKEFLRHYVKGILSFFSEFETRFKGFNQCAD